MFIPLLESTEIVPAQEFAPHAASSWLKGALLLLEAAGTLAECGADPAEVSGVAVGQHGADTGGYNILASHDVPPGKVQMFPARGHKFVADYTGALPAALGGDYGVVKAASGEWQVDFGEVVATVVTLVGFGTANDLGDAARKRVVVRFLDTVATNL